MKAIYFNGRRWEVLGRDGRTHIWARVVAAGILGRELQPGEVVHHINGDPTDDRPENLQVVTPAEHRAIHVRQGDAHVLTAEDRQKSCDRQRNTQTRPCCECGAPVTRPASHFANRKTWFCSIDCRSAYRRLVTPDALAQIMESDLPARVLATRLGIAASTVYATRSEHRQMLKARAAERAA